METIGHSNSRTEQYDTIRERNAEAYKLFFDIEVILREFIQSRLYSLHGQRWIRLGVPADIQDKIKAGVASEKRVSWSQGIIHPPLYFIDFPDLKKLIISGTNWPSAFSDIFLGKSTPDSALSDIELVRNKVAHNRVASQRDLAVLQSAWVKLIGSLSTSAVEDAKSRVSRRVLVRNDAHTLYAELLSAHAAMRRGERLADSANSVFQISENWWFNEVYLGCDLSSISSAVELCKHYMQIPQGLGQAVVRRQWVNDNNADVAMQEATNQFDSLLEDIDRHYG